ncbi:hypothetical protein ABZ916_25870 [Streptomyces sp. NPDC046853]|uniref:hypothetical protein n=1 Tax=Streptomyces sp. NPDC046853 TaxID=3154920 RepID=UPI0033F37AD8
MMFDDYDNSEEAYVDSVLYADQTNPDFPTYQANGWCGANYGVVAVLNGKDIEVYDGTDVKRAETEALSAYARYHGKAEVLVMQDGSNWKWVFGLPKDRFPNDEPKLTHSGFCPDPRCGDVNPLDCWCRYNLTPEQIKRYAQFD